MIRALEARVLELEKATNDTSLVEKVAAMEAKILDIKRDDASKKDGREFSNLKAPIRKYDLQQHISYQRRARETHDKKA